MRITENTNVQDIRDKAIRLYRIRVAAVLFLTPVFLFTYYVGNVELPIIPLMILGLAEIILNFPYRIFMKDSERAFKFLATSVMADFLAETLTIHFIGGVEAMFFSAIFLLSILYCALNLPSSFNFIMATLASIFYSGLIAAEYYGVIPHRPTMGLIFSGTQQTVLVLSHVAFFYLIAFFAQFLAKALTEKEERLAKLNSDLKDAYQKIKYTYRMKSEFVARMSHELRSPLCTNLSLTALLKTRENGLLNEKQLSYTDKIEQSTKHLLDLINEILDISKIEAEKVAIHWTEIDLGEICRTVIDIFNEEAVMKDIHLRFDNVHSSGYKLEADEKRMRQILYNLISNALKFTPPNGDVSVSIEKSEDILTLTVSDTGIGISKENIQRIFMPYEQVNENLSADIMGTGLGLAITKQFVELQGGQVIVRSEPGKGSRFICIFPIKRNQPAEQK
ncbi:MAG: HAMP domain-containing histidine kinase [Candidatus Omnitrophica bacterium]|nr:HAMP domain-containing histidine kinase [Candidatus Omnitrophota bacterium]